MANKDSIPEEVINYCIDNKVSIEEGMIAMIDAKLEKAERDIKTLKDDSINLLNQYNNVTQQDMDSIEDFLNNLNQQNPE